MFSQPRILKEGDETPGVQKTSKSTNMLLWDVGAKKGCGR